jgi:hypothetical protein
MSQFSFASVAERLGHLSRRQRQTLAGLGLLLALVLVGATILVVALPDAKGSTSTPANLATAPVQPLTTSTLTDTASVAATQQWGHAGPTFAQRIVFAPNAPGTAYACGSAGRAGQRLALGVSADGGHTWHDLATSLVSQTCLLSVAPTNPKAVALMTAQCGTNCASHATVALYRSADGGATWTQAFLPQGGFGLLMAWADTTLFVTTNDVAHPLAVSVNGQPFALQDDITRYGGQVNVLGGVGATMYATLTANGAVAPTIVKSANDGAIWSQVTLNDTPFTVNLLRTSADNTALMGLEHTDTLALSFDQGQTWTEAPPFPTGLTLAAPNFVARTPDGTLVALLQTGTTPILYAVLVGAGSWQPIAANLPATSAMQALAWNSQGHPVALWAATNTLTNTAKQLWTYQF